MYGAKKTPGAELLVRKKKRVEKFREKRFTFFSHELLSNLKDAFMDF